ncbi:unnamed protein product [Calicophoron daubneyi]|uniref:Thioesterase domain-containing protein n=1 Tax=Calicophoron daubneyi TaxID=300641 RepID=A0AAV2TBU7_CALDB
MMTVELVNKIIASRISSNFNAMFKTLQAVAVAGDCLTCRFQVTDPLLNHNGVLHGGYVATATDFVSSVDLERLGYHRHASVHLAVEFMRPSSPNSTIKVESYIMHKGKSLAFCRVLFTNEDTGKLIACGSHTKFLFDS